MSESLLHHETLPTELWLEIFTHLDARSYTVAYYEPFQPLPGIASERNAFVSVVSVCRDWRVLALELLFRNIKLSESIRLGGLTDIQRAYGRWVRRAVVPYSTTVTETHGKPMLSTEILGLCPNLEVLVRPPEALNPMRSLKFHFDATCPPLQSLSALHWWNHLEASRSGGINCLTSVLSAAPNLEYLFIGGRNTDFSFPYAIAADIHLPRLRTLRLNTADAMLLRQVLHYWALPAMDTLVIDSANMEQVWDAEPFVSQLAVVEFGKNLHFLLRQTLSPCLRSCPSLRELNYYVFITLPPEIVPGEAYASVTSIGINLSENAYLGGEQEGWAHLRRHFDAFAGDMFPNLQRLRLFAAREPLLSDARFSSMHQRLNDRGCIVEFSDGTPLLSLPT
ncbi:hypothetical protein C8R44DRAFT_599418 [Mycena epipterygia]|nr:hypothetical protein C8R44DRAFT_599418 [Mycena epipterygia]